MNLKTFFHFSNIRKKKKLRIVLFKPYDWNLKIKIYNLLTEIRRLQLVSPSLQPFGLSRSALVLKTNIQHFVFEKVLIPTEHTLSPSQDIALWLYEHPALIFCLFALPASIHNGTLSLLSLYPVKVYIALILFYDLVPAWVHGWQSIWIFRRYLSVQANTHPFICNEVEIEFTLEMPNMTYESKIGWQV